MCAATLITPTVAIAHKDCTKNYYKYFIRILPKDIMAKKGACLCSALLQWKVGRQQLVSNFSNIFFHRTNFKKKLRNWICICTMMLVAQVCQTWRQLHCKEGPKRADFSGLLPSSLCSCHHHDQSINVDQLTRWIWYYATSSFYLSPVLVVMVETTLRC